MKMSLDSFLREQPCLTRAERRAFECMAVIGQREVVSTFLIGGLRIFIPSRKTLISSLAANSQSLFFKWGISCAGPFRDGVLLV